MILARTRRLRRFALVGLSCAVAQNAVVIGGDALGLHYALAMLVAFATVTPLGYLLHSLFTFEERMNWARFSRFFFGVAAATPLAFLLMFVLCTLLAVPVPPAVVIATGILFTWNYLSARWAITRHVAVRRA